MKKRRPCAKNYFSSQKYSCAHERLPIKAKSTHDSKGRSSKRSSSKLQQNSEQFGDASCLKKDPFASLETLFDVKKSLNLRDVYPLASSYCTEKSINFKQESVEVSDTSKSKPPVETIFLQSFSPRTNLRPRIFKPYFEHNAKNEIIANEQLQVEISSSAQRLQQYDLIINQKNYLINMAEAESEIPEEQREEIEPIIGDDVVDQEPAIIEDIAMDIEKEEKGEEKDEEKGEEKDQEKDEEKDEGKDEEEDEKKDKYEFEDEEEGKDEVEEESKVDEDKVGDEDKIDDESKISDEKKDKIEDEISLQREFPNISILSGEQITKKCKALLNQVLTISDTWSSLTIFQDRNA